MITEIDRAVLEVAGQFWRFPGARAEHIRERFGWSETRFWQTVNRLLTTPEAEAEYPVLVHRLRRMQADRLEARSVRRLRRTP